MELNKLKARIYSAMGEPASIFGVALIEQMKRRDDIFVLSADMSNYAGLDKFKKAYPHRFINMGIAEQNMVGTAAGLASEGFRPVVEAQSCFLSMRAFEQVRQYAGYMKFPIIFVGINAGMSLEYMGNTHFSIEDLGLMRNIPGMTVFSPSDAGEATKVFEAALEINGPSYIRLMGSMGARTVFSEDFNLVPGNAICLREGSDVQILATGNMVSEALDAAVALEQNGISASVFDVHTIKPLDTECISTSARLLVTVEEHTIVSGLGAAVASHIAGNDKHYPNLLQIGINDCFGHVGEYRYMLEQAGLTAHDIENKIFEQYKKIHTL